jgi:hypothetical protein
MFMVVVEDDAAPPEDQQTVDAEIKFLLVSSPRVVQVNERRRYTLISASGFLYRRPRSTVFILPTHLILSKKLVLQ